MASFPLRPSLFRSHVTVPCYVRYGLPALLLLNMALLLYSNLTLGASVHARIYDGQGNNIELPVLYNVSLAGSIEDMWKGGAYWMSALIAVCSGVWPHFKLVLSLLCWVLDERHLPPRKRARALSLTYVLQKFSHVETMTLVILMTAFSFTARLPNHDDWGVWTYVTPQPGFYAFLAGLILSMFLSRVALYYDHVSRHAAAATAAATRAPSFLMLAESDGEAVVMANRKDSVDNNEAFDLPSLLWASSSSMGKRMHGDNVDNAGRGAATRREPSVWWEVLRSYLLLAVGVSFVMGLVLPAFTFHFKGLAGWVLDNVTVNSQDSSSSLRTASVVSLGRGIPGASDTPEGVGICFLQAAFFFFVVGAPLGCLTLLLGLLVLPPKYGQWLTTPAEILYAWSAPDVLFVSMVASTLEMYLFVRFVIGDRCDTLNALLKKIMDDELAGDDKCFDVATSLKPGCFVLGASSLLFFVGGFLIIRKATRETEEYLEKEGRGRRDLHRHDRDGDEEEEEREWRQRQRRRDTQQGGTASTDVSRSLLEEEEEEVCGWQHGGASPLLSLSESSWPGEEPEVLRDGRDQGREEEGGAFRGLRGWFRGWGARRGEAQPTPRQSLQTQQPTNASAQ